MSHRLPPSHGSVGLRKTAIALSIAALPAAAFAQAVAPEEKQLEAVVVTASGFEQTVKEAPASITVISREQLEEKRASNLTQVLEDVEGIDVGDSAGKTGGLNISIRGMPSDYTLVLIDGRRQNTAGSITPNGFGETSTSFMPPVASIERIEIIRGPMSTLYGSDAMGGVINIITRKVAKTWGGSVTLEGTLQGNEEFGNSGKVEAYVSGPLKADLLGLALRASNFQREASDLQATGDAGDETISKRGPSPVEGRISTFGARLSLTPNKQHDLWLDADTTRQSYDNSANQLGTATVQGGYTGKQEFNQSAYVLGYTGRLGFGVLDASYMHNTRETLGRTIPPGTPGKVAGTPRTLESTNQILDTKLVSSFGSHVLTVGGQYTDAEMTDAVAPAPYTSEQWALFVEDEWRLVDSFALTLGLRHADHSAFGGHTSPRIYGVWSLTDRWTIKGGVSQGYRTPNLEQLADGINGFTNQGRNPSIGTPSLKPETSTTTELGTIFDNHAGLLVGATVFNNKFKDKIASGEPLLNCSFAGSPNRPDCVDYGNWPTVDTFSQRVNVDEAVTRGLELTTRIPLATRWSLSGNYTYTESEQKSGANRGDPLGNTPRHMLNASLRWTVDEAFSTWLRTEYRSKRHRSAGNAKTALGDYKAYTVFHLGASYKASSNVTLNATIYNLLDKDFLKYGSYADPTATNPSQVSYTNLYNNMQEGRRLWLSANISF